MVQPSIVIRPNEANLPRFLFSGSAIIVHYSMSMALTMHSYGLSGDEHACLTLYLRNRTNVAQHDVKSSVSEVNNSTTGVPQGSVVGLIVILFN